MRLVDANVLLYAVDRGADHHRAAKTWLDAALRGPQTVLLPWVSVLAFVRLVSHPSVYEHPLPVSDALDVVDTWLAAPSVVTPEPDARHLARIRELLGATGRGGNLVNDAHLAALALQHRATVITFDNDFGRFPDVLWERPTA
ncbi:TA system VapC family ribonuclease toxin [Agromyces laixinhei]|uniref:TA system VapC family ribonuclease toxin n=1 Tax=Agromyces laixinhei TaxID=2585717 RepID=UPI0011172CE4|nr:TA system VapC family ribonuclease toxin [Agromyces laixinhei]